MKVQFHVEEKKQDSFNVHDEYVGWGTGKFDAEKTLILASMNEPCPTLGAFVCVGLTNLRTQAQYLVDGFVVYSASVTHMDSDSPRFFGKSEGPMTLEVARIRRVHIEDCQAEQEDVPSGASPEDYSVRTTSYFKVSIPPNLTLSVYAKDVVEVLLPSPPDNVSETIRLP